ncbi:hypothetical protein EBL87_09010 [Cereibacter sphaeroides]|uniref:hypothetical protein n=1 Tax=Cereibacter sphaeroides TaxID=1063 RepID=UPI000F531A5E|nr:hypothetical protein [Cereibacter sphaeroides]AZB63868.1 hypothetical protein EBL87_09010 [Cereibacter sphaeroides]AZB68210.1 hypothetical protein EBL86_07460 [Cereibacter sphaeroides]
MKAKIVSLAALAALTATGNGSAVDVAEFVGHAQLILSHSAPGGTTPTWDFKLQTSDDGSTGWEDYHTFAQIAGGASAGIVTAEIDADGLGKYVRLVRTAGGTSPTISAALSIVGKTRTMP